MLKNLAWNTFKNTGNIDTFMELVEVENIEKNIGKNIERSIGNLEHGNNQDKRNSSFRE